MTVKELIEQLEDMDPDAKVVTPGMDHSYDEAYACEAEEGFELRNHISEYYGPEYHDEEGDGVVINVVVIR